MNIIQRVREVGRSISYPRLLIVVAGIILAIILRLSLIDYRSSDFFGYTKYWYLALKEGGFSAFSQDFSNYNLPYLYLLYGVVRFFPDIPAPIAVKIPSLVADFAIAWLVYQIVRTKSPDTALPMMAGLATLFAPTVVLNGAFWGQADALYAAALLATLYFMIKRRPGWAMAAFGLAFAFKAQAAFLAPVLLIMLVRREIPWRYAPLGICMPLLALVPAALAGRPLLELLLIYPAQAGQYEMLNMHAPSVFALLPDNSNTYQYFYPAGIIISVAVSLFFVAFVQQSRARMSPKLLVELSLASVLLIPFFLPKMHERYFFAADVISIVFAAFSPAYYYVAIGISAVSFLAYQPYLFGQGLVPMAWLALALLAILTVVLWRTVLDLRPCPPGFGDQESPAPT